MWWPGDLSASILDAFVHSPGLASVTAPAAGALPVPQVGYDPRTNWLPVLLLLVVGIGFAATNILVSVLVGPGRTGQGKSAPYESGMVPVGDTRRRFNVRFYVVAMVFLVFDVVIVFFYPFAGIFASFVEYDAAAGTGRAGHLLVNMTVFTAIALTAYVYAWGKGIFRFD